MVFYSGKTRFPQKRPYTGPSRSAFNILSQFFGIREKPSSIPPCKTHVFRRTSQNGHHSMVFYSGKTRFPQKRPYTGPSRSAFNMSWILYYPQDFPGPFPRWQEGPHCRPRAARTPRIAPPFFTPRRTASAYRRSFPKTAAPSVGVRPTFGRRPKRPRKREKTHTLVVQKIAQRIGPHE